MVKSKLPVHPLSDIFDRKLHLNKGKTDQIARLRLSTLGYHLVKDFQPKNDFWLTLGKTLPLHLQKDFKERFDNYFESVTTDHTRRYIPEEMYFQQWSM